jgi:hypothetical protein
MTPTNVTASVRRSSRHEALVPHRHEEEAQGASCDDSRFAALLKEPAVALWAFETAVRYEISALHALRLLAQALVLDP